MNVTTAQTKKDFLENVCEFIRRKANYYIQEKGSFNLVLSGGQTPVFIFKELCSQYLDLIEWDNVHVFWLDERCVEPTNEMSNYGSAYEHLLSKLPSVGSIHRIDGEKDALAASREYTGLLIEYFGSKDKIAFDLVIAGVGTDGHVASLFADINSYSGNSSDIVIPTINPNDGSSRVSMNYHLINQSKLNLLLINSQEKLDILLNEHGIELPIHRVRIDEVMVHIQE